MVKVAGLRSAGAIRVGSIPTPCKTVSLLFKKAKKQLSKEELRWAHRFSRERGTHRSLDRNQKLLMRAVNSVVECQISNLLTRVRFPDSAYRKVQPQGTLARALLPIWCNG